MAAVGFALNRFMNAVDRWLILFAQLMLAVMVLITFVSVIGRTFLNTSVPDDLLIMELLMVVLVFLPLSWVQSLGAHLEVTVLTDFFPEAVQKALVSFGLFLGLVMFGGMAYVSWESAYESYAFGELAYNSVLNLRDWPAKMLIPIGLGWWCLRMVVQLIWPATRHEAETEYKSALKDTEYLNEER
ncbi:MAG: TRAP transporter small permease [Marinobacter sp.]|jgi:TRAP-type C4-dicarboxylate transport system permease small subunit|nr:TRAP transporter small permease [Marinobacter sp.]